MEEIVLVLVPVRAPLLPSTEEEVVEDPDPGLDLDLGPALGPGLHTTAENVALVAIAQDQDLAAGHAHEPPNTRGDARLVAAPFAAGIVVAPDHPLLPVRPSPTNQDAAEVAVVDAMTRKTNKAHVEMLLRAPALPTTDGPNGTDLMPSKPDEIVGDTHSEREGIPPAQSCLFGVCLSVSVFLVFLCAFLFFVQGCQDCPVSPLPIKCLPFQHFSSTVRRLNEYFFVCVSQSSRAKICKLA